MTIQLHRGSTAPHPHHPGVSDDEAEDLVAVRRNVVLSGAVGGGALLLGLGFLGRASSGLDIMLGLVLLLVAGLNLPAVASARTPVLVADDYGIRFRVGLGWRGLPWTAIRQVVVEDPSSLLREGRLVLVPQDRDAVLRRLGPVAQWHLRWNEFWYGSPLSVPLGITTAIDSDDLAADLTALAAGRVEIVHVPAADQVWTEAPEMVEVLAAQPVPEEDGEPVLARPVRLLPEPALLAGPVVETVAEAAPDETPDELLPPASELPEPVLPLRSVSAPIRVDVRLEVPEDEGPEDEGHQDGVAEDVAPEDTAGSVEHRVPPQLSRNSAENAPSWDSLPVEGLAAQELPVEIVIDDLAVLPPVAEPIIGTKVAHARECLDMSIDELSQRTRIRPHVLEAVERDDFGPCGGDFYARGHLTAISRALGLTLEPLLQVYDERYAQAPVNARRVFEAELSSGLSGGVRATLSGPRWSLLIGSVLSLTMIWGLARILAGDGEELTVAPPSSQTAGLAGNQTPITSPLMKTTPMSVTAAYAGTRIVVKDRTGKVLWSGDLALGKKRKIIGLAPFTVSAENAGAVVVSVRGKQLGDLGTAGEPGTKKFG